MDITLDWFKLNAFADYSLDVLDRVENIVGKVGNAGYLQHLVSKAFLSN